MKAEDLRSFSLTRIGGKDQLLKDISEARSKPVVHAKDRIGRRLEAEVRVSSAACGDECGKHWRVADALADGVLCDVNVSFISLNDTVKTRVASDAALTAAGDIEGSHWHFYPNALGTAWGFPELFEYPVERGIKYTIHVPVE